MVLEALFHAGAKRIGLHFPYETELIALAKEAGGTWSNSHKCWHVADGSASLKKVYAIFKGKAQIDGHVFFGEPSNKPSLKSQTKVAAAPKAQAAPPELSTAQQDALNAMQRKLEIARYTIWTCRTV